MSDLRPMDIYSTHEIDFNMAAYCRGHKFSIEAVRLAKAIRNEQETRRQLAHAEMLLDSALESLKAAKAAVHAKMERDPL